MRSYLFLLFLLATDLVAQPGTIDSTFAENGVFSSIELFSPGFRRLSLQNDQKILLAGYADFQGASMTDFMTMRINEDGTPDDSYGTFQGGYGDGVAQIWWGFNSYDYLNSIRQQSDGRIIISGTGDVTNYFVLGRLLENGEVDPSFGDGLNTGVLGYPLFDAGLNPTGIGTSGDMEIDAQDRIVVAGTAAGRITLLRVLPDGDDYDDTFAEIGYRFYTEFDSTYLNTVEDLLLLEDGSMLLTGRSYLAPDDSDAYLLKILEDGEIDQSFAEEGFLRLALETEQSIGQKIALEADGSIVLGANTVSPAGDDIDLLVYKITPSGELDPTFGVNGSYRLANSEKSFCNGIAVESNGRIVAAGAWAPAGSFSYAPLVVGLLPTGEPDANYGEGGFFRMEAGSAAGFIDDAILQGEDKLVLAGVYAGRYVAVRVHGGGNLFTSQQEISDKPLSYWPTPSESGRVYFSQPIQGQLFDLHGQPLNRYENTNDLQLPYPGMFLLKLKNGQVLKLMRAGW